MSTKRKNVERGLMLYKSSAIKPVDMVESTTKGITSGIPQTEVVFDNKDGIDANSITRFIGSSESVDRDGEIVLLDAWDFTNFVNNPVVLWGHEHRGLPIGKIVGISKDTTRKLLYFDVMLTDAHQLARDVKQLVADGIVKATSVGFRINDWKWIEETLVFTKVELMELSLVTVPANQDALVANAYGDNMEVKDKEVDDLREVISGMQDALNNVSTAIGDLKVRVEAIANTQPAEPTPPPAEEPPAEPTPPAALEAAEPTVEVTADILRDLLTEIVASIISPPNQGDPSPEPTQSGSEGEDDIQGSNNPEPNTEDEAVVTVSIGDLDALDEFIIINEEE